MWRVRRWGHLKEAPASVGVEDRVQEDFLKEVTPKLSPSQKHLGKGIQTSGAMVARAWRWDTVIVGEEAPSNSSGGC